MIHAYVYFFQSRQQSGDLRGLKATEAAKLVGREWKALTASEKKVCLSRLQADSDADIF